MCLPFVLLGAQHCFPGSLLSSVDFPGGEGGKIDPILCVKIFFQLLSAADGPIAAWKKPLWLSLRHFKFGSIRLLVSVRKGHPCSAAGFLSVQAPAGKQVSGHSQISEVLVLRAAFCRGLQRRSPLALEQACKIGHQG